MNRRNLLLLPFAAALSIKTSPAVAQDNQEFPLRTAPLDALQAYVRDPIARSELFTAVEFIHKFRADLAPNKYEQNPEWLEGARDNRRRVWRVSTELVEKYRDQALDLPTDFVESYNQSIAEQYVRNREAFDEFLTNIGIDTGGPAAFYLRFSLYYFCTD